MKCGTTSLYNYLAQHPEVATSPIKEVSFFNSPSRFSKGFDFYQNLWDWNPEQHKYALEATPGYTRVTHQKYLNAADNIDRISKSHKINFKFIYILRNPIDRVESHYTQGRKYLHQDTARPISEGINREIIDTSKYAMQIDEYYQRFSPENILLLDFEDLKNNPERLLKHACKFLEINQDFEFKGVDLVHNPYKSESSRVFLPGYSAFRKTEYVKDLISFMPRSVKQKAQVFRNLFARKINYEYVKLSSDQRNQIKEELRADLIKLRDEYKVDINSWGIKL